MLRAIVLTAAFVVFSASARAEDMLKGTIDIMGQGAEISQEIWVMAPDKLKEKADLEIGGQKIAFAAVVNGDKVSLNANGMDFPIPDASREDMKNGAWFTGLVMIVGLKSKDVELSPVGEAQVNNRPAVGVKVSAKGRKGGNLFFDKETGLLVKMERQALDFNTMQEVKEERFIQEYQEVQGIKVAKKMLIQRDGQKFLETEVTSAKFLDKLDDNVFQP